MLLRLLDKATSKDSNNRGSAFQLIWATLHLAAVALHFGSFVYHARRVHRKEENYDLATKNLPNPH